MNEDKKSKILIVDDETAIRLLLRNRLINEGYEVIEAVDGKDALNKVELDKPDLIILDVMMPNIDGYQCFKELKRNPQTANIPIIMLTARGQMRDTFEVLDADAFIPKPFNPEELMRNVKMLLVRHVLVLAKHPYVVSLISDELSRLGYQANILEDKLSFCRQATEYKYNKIIIHLALVDEPASQFMLRVKNFKNPYPSILVYCDANVKGTESNDTVVIDKLSHEWRRQGITAFYDGRINNQNFNELLKKWVNS